jgi:CheY-like chemotaxis protein
VSRYILVAEDENDLRELLRLALEGAGYSVRAAADGAAALELARSDPPRLLVTDLRMPVMDGLDLIHALRADPRLRGLPVVLFTAYAASDPRVGEAAALPGVEVVTKGPLGELREAVARALGDRAAGHR